MLTFSFSSSNTRYGSTISADNGTVGGGGYFRSCSSGKSLGDISSLSLAALTLPTGTLFVGADS